MTLRMKSLWPITRWQIVGSSKLKEFADDNFKFDKNGRKLSKRVENTVGKGEIARYEQFLLFPQCFQKVCFLRASKDVIVWEWVKTIQEKAGNHFSTMFSTLSKTEIIILAIIHLSFANALKCLENILEKGENAGNHFSTFSTLSKTEIIVSTNALNGVQSKMFMFG